MPPRPIKKDVLWACLCPRYPTLPTPQPFQVAWRQRATSGTARGGSRLRRSCGEGQLRTHNTAASATQGSAVPPGDYFGESRAPELPSNDTRSRRGLKEVPLVALPVTDLYERLRYDGAAGRCDDVMNICRILIKDRREKPNGQMYTAILHSFVNCAEGTAGKLRKVLEEMAEVGVELDGRGAECVLEALAVHPDYLLRTEILQYMKMRWFGLSDSAHNFVVAGMLRDRLFEQALEKLDEMVAQRVKVKSWLWDKTLWMLLEFGEVEEAFYVLSLRQSVEGPATKLSNALWLRLLDAASKRHLSEPTNMIWNAQVVPGYIKPPSGTCLDVLSVASRSGNVALATDVFRVLAGRDTVLTADHYEALLECYLIANDLSAALSVVLIMQDSGIKIKTDALHPLYSYLKGQDSRPMDAFTILQDLESGGKNVPAAAANTCLQASISLDRLAEALEMYKVLHTVCKSGPNTATFNILFQGCHRAGRKELAMYLANEMIQLNIQPDRITYDRLILVCLNAGDVNDALLYYEEMRGQGYMPRRGTHEKLIRISLDNGDERCVAVLRDYKEKGGVGEGRAIMFERMVRARFENAPEEPLVPDSGDTLSADGSETPLDALANEDGERPRLDGLEKMSERTSP